MKMLWLFAEKLISGCPVLEDLTVYMDFDDDVPLLRVRWDLRLLRGFILINTSDYMWSLLLLISISSAKWVVMSGRSSGLGTFLICRTFVKGLFFLLLNPMSLFVAPILTQFQPSCNLILIILLATYYFIHPCNHTALCLCTSFCYERERYMCWPFFCSWF